MVMFGLLVCATLNAGPVRVLAVGNSYTQSLMPEFPQVAKAAGVDLDLAIFAIGASRPATTG